MPAAKPAAAAPSSSSPPAPNISCTAPSARPPPGNAPSSAATPKGITPCRAGRSIWRIRSRNAMRLLLVTRGMLLEHLSSYFVLYFLRLSIRSDLSLRCHMPNARRPARSSSEADAAEITARILLETESVLFRPEDPFTFTSGLRSPVYIDCRRLISFPRARKKLMDLAAELIARHAGFESLDAVAGGETAGIPFAAWIADRLSLPMLYVRKQPKGFGRNAQIEGELKEGARVLLVEDLASEGTSKLNFVRAIRQAGGRIDDAFVIFNYGIFPQIDTSLAAEGITLLALATWWDVAATAERLGRFGPGQYAAVESFLKNPEAWSKARAVARR